MIPSWILWFVGGFVSGITIGLLMLFLIMWAFSKCFDEVIVSVLERLAGYPEYGNRN